MKAHGTFISILISMTSVDSSYAQQSAAPVKIAGQMKDVMWEGQLHGKIELDTILNREHLYGLGPVEYLTGEIMIIDGRCFISEVESDTSMRVEETFAVKAPFFGYANVSNWKPTVLPDTVLDPLQLQYHLEKETSVRDQPFFFKLNGYVENATVHVVNLPGGSTVSSPEEAHRGQKDYAIGNEKVEILGFFSTRHKTIFTHHDTFLHMHLMTHDRKKMGHLDAFRFKKGEMMLYLPSDSVE